MGITSNVKFPSTFGHPIRLGFTLEVSGFGELQPRVCVGPRERPIIEDLLRKGARVNSKGGWTGGTALHVAVMFRNYEAIETLLAAGADVHMLDGDGLTPSQKAPGDECVIYLFSGGKIADKPGTRQPPKGESTKVQF